MTSSNDLDKLPESMSASAPAGIPPADPSGANRQLEMPSGHAAIQTGLKLGGSASQLRAEVWKCAIWAALGGAFGAALTFAAFATEWHEKWLGFVLALAWVMTWKHFAEPHVEKKLTGSAPTAAHHATESSRKERSWLAQIVLSLLLVISVLGIEAIVELIHAHARDDSANFLMELIGPAATIFAVMVAWTLGVRQPKPRASLFGLTAGLVLPIIIFVCIGLYLYRGALPARYLALGMLPSAIFWGLAGFFGGWAADVRKNSNPTAAISLSLLILVAAWSLILVAVCRLLVLSEVLNISSFELVFSVSLNVLRVVGWLSALWLCPWTERAFQVEQPTAQRLHA